MLLHNGAEEQDQLVSATWLHLLALMGDHPVAFYELVLLARDPDHILFGNAGEKLVECDLIGPDNKMHASVRNITLSSVTGDGPDMQLRFPGTTASDEGGPDND